MTHQETEALQEAIETAVAFSRKVVFPIYDPGIMLRFSYNQFCLDEVYWKDDKGQIYSVWLEIRYHPQEVIPGLYVIGTYTPDKFSSGNLKMIRKENRCFPEVSDNPIGKEKWREEAECLWVIDEDGGAHCPYCQAYTIENEYTGKPILFKYCPECGKFLNGPGQRSLSLEKNNHRRQGLNDDILK